MILAWPWFALALALPLLVRFGLPPLSRASRARLVLEGGSLRGAQNRRHPASCHWRCSGKPLSRR